MSISIKNVSTLSLHDPASSLFSEMCRAGSRFRGAFYSACSDTCLPRQIARPCFLSASLAWFKPVTHLSPPSSFLSPPFEKLEDWFEALSLNQEMGIPLPAELDELQHSFWRLHCPKDGAAAQSAEQPALAAASPEPSGAADSSSAEHLPDSSALLH